MVGKSGIKNSIETVSCYGLSLLLFLLLLLASSGFCADIQRVTNNPGYDTDVDIAKDSSGKTHIVYKRAETIYYWNSSERKEELIAKGRNPTIAIGPNDVPQVAFISGTVKYTQRFNGSWETPVRVPHEIYWVSHVDIAVDNNNGTHFVYILSTPEPEHANILLWSTKKNGIFSVPFILHYYPEEKIGQYYYQELTGSPGIVVDGNGKPHVVVSLTSFKTHQTDVEDFLIKSSMRYFSNDVFGKFIGSTGEYNYEELSDNFIAVDSNGNIHVAYSILTDDGFILYLKNMDKSFKVTTTFESSGRHASLSYNRKTNSIGLSYRDNQTIYYRIYNGTGISSKKYVAIGYWPSIVLGSIDVAYMGMIDSNMEIFLASNLEIENTKEDEWILFTPAIIDKKPYRIPF
jgi:hypothetical protein